MQGKQIHLKYLNPLHLRASVSACARIKAVLLARLLKSQSKTFLCRFIVRFMRTIWPRAVKTANTQFLAILL